MNLIDRILAKPAEAPPYDQEVAYLLALISAWSYSDSGTLLKIIRRRTVAGRECAVNIESFSVRNPAFPVDVNAYLIRFGEGQTKNPLHVVCFRGTELTNIIDLLTDAMVEPHPWPGGTRDEWVHRGFFLSLDVLWPELCEALEGR